MVPGMGAHGYTLTSFTLSMITQCNGAKYILNNCQCGKKGICKDLLSLFFFLKLDVLKLLFE